MRILDLFCGAGGAAMGYHRAGFEVVGVDLAPQRRFPFEFIRADALTFPLDGFDAVHASPVCKRYSQATRTARVDPTTHPDQIAPIRERLIASGLPYVIENVEGAPLIDPVRLCGSSFGLDVRRHRLFESNIALTAPPCDHAWQTPRFHPNRSDRKGTGRLASVIVVAGHGNDGPGGRVDDWRRAMGIPWMTRDELAQAIPPAYTEHVGTQIMAHLAARAT
jgi:DNA (cytosine-5)-methyltransferase 1